MPLLIGFLVMLFIVEFFFHFEPLVNYRTNENMGWCHRKDSIAKDFSYVLLFTDP